MEIHISCIYVLQPPPPPQPHPPPPPIPSHFSVQDKYKVESRVQSPESRVQDPLLLLAYAIIRRQMLKI